MRLRRMAPRAGLVLLSLLVVVVKANALQSTLRGSSSPGLRRGLVNSSAVPVLDRQQDLGCPSDGEQYDYVVVGGGPAGIIVAERLSTAHKVLLLEEGQPGLASNGAAQWRLGGSELYPLCGDGGCSMFDCLGCYENLWDVKDPQGRMPVDVHEPHILGGASTINGGLWFVPPSEDLDRDWPSGWKAGDVMPYYDRVRQRLSVTNRPSADKRLYNQEYYDAVAGGLRAHGWREVDDFNDKDTRTAKYDKVFGHPSFLNKGGLRDTPARSYLADAQARPTFRLVTGADVMEVLRGNTTDSRGRATGVVYHRQGRTCTATLKAGAGAVVVSAGAIGTPRLLFRSGIGPRDQVSLLSVGGKDHVGDGTWIDAPRVGANLFDTPMVPVQLQGSLPGFRHDCRNPHPDDARLFTTSRSGPYASSGPLMVGWTERINPQGKAKYYEATLVPHAYLPPFDRPIYSLNLYLCNPDSRVTVAFNADGSLALPPDSLLYRPGTSDFEDMAAWVAEIVGSTTQGVPAGGLQPSEPSSSGDAAVKEYMRRMSFVTNHWGGSMQLGEATDLHLRVIGTDNIYVADASVFPAPVRVNPQATVMMVAERLADDLLRSGA